MESFRDFRGRVLLQKRAALDVVMYIHLSHEAGERMKLFDQGMT